MKKITLIAILLMFSSLVSFAQKYAFVDSEYILNNIPTYEAAKAQLDKQSKDWQAEVEKAFAEVEQMYKKFQADKIMLSDEMKTKREDEIVKKEAEANALKKKYFGQQGELYKKRQELVKPIQDEVYNAVKTIATEGNYAIIFDVASNPGILFTDPKYDKSDDVLQKMGYKGTR